MIIPNPPDTFFHSTTVFQVKLVTDQDKCQRLQRPPWYKDRYPVGGDIGACDSEVPLSTAAQVLQLHCLGCCVGAAFPEAT